MGGIYVSCVFPNVTLIMQYVLYIISSSRLLTFPLAKEFNHTSILDVEVTIRCYGRRARLSPRAMAPSPSKTNSGLAAPTLADLYRLFEERFERQLKTNEELIRKDRQDFERLAKYGSTFSRPGA